MKKPKIEDYIDIRVYDIELSAYIDHIEAVNTELLEALIKIAKWELPETGKFWDEKEKERPMSYEAAYGSNGARDYIKNIAKQAIKKTL